MKLRRSVITLAWAAVLLATLTGGVLIGAQLGRLDLQGRSAIAVLVLFFALQLWQASVLRRVDREADEP